MMQISWQAIPKPVEDLFYALEPMIMGILLTNMLQWSYHKAVATRSGTHWNIFGPVYLIAAATVMCMAMPMAVLFIYVGRLNYPESKMWKASKWFPNTPHGILLYLIKWIGTGVLMVGMLQITQLHAKILSRWRQLRDAKEVVVVGGKCSPSGEGSAASDIRHFANGRFTSSSSSKVAPSSAS